MNTKLHAVTDTCGCPIRFFMSAGHGDYTGAAAHLGTLQAAQRLLADRGNDADWFCEALPHRTRDQACIPSHKTRKISTKNYKRRYKRRDRIEIMFDRLKD
ncbi:MAG: hypothetical protein JXK05_14070 [Campylobacterales bacterium]|nr:hypothetical protein [Campylobacterales bacterium]